MRKYDGAALFDLGLDDRRRSAIDLRQEAHAAINLIDGLPLTAKHGSAKSSGAARLSHRLVASLLDFETAMTIADYNRYRRSDRIGDIGRGDAVSPRQVLTGAAHPN